MRGPSRVALADVKERLSEAVTADPAGAGGLGEDLFAVAGLLGAEPGLRRAFADNTAPASAREALAAELLGGRVSPAAAGLAAALAAGRWSAPGDLVNATEQLAVLAIAAGADASGQLDDLEDELFRFGRIVSGETSLRSALADAQMPADRKRGLLGELLAAKVTPAALRLITQAVLYPRGRSLESSLSEYAHLAAEWRQRLVAVVRVATGLTAAQRERLGAALRASYGRDVHLNVVIDSDVVGGMSVQIGDEFIDGSLSSRLALLRRRLVA